MNFILIWRKQMNLYPLGRYDAVVAHDDSLGFELFVYVLV